MVAQRPERRKWRYATEKSSTLYEVIQCQLKVQCDQFKDVYYKL